MMGAVMMWIYKCKNYKEKKMKKDEVPKHGANIDEDEKRIGGKR